MLHVNISWLVAEYPLFCVHLVDGYMNLCHLLSLAEVYV